MSRRRRCNYFQVPMACQNAVAPVTMPPEFVLAYRLAVFPPGRGWADTPNTTTEFAYIAVAVIFGVPENAIGNVISAYPAPPELDAGKVPRPHWINVPSGNLRYPFPSSVILLFNY